MKKTITAITVFFLFSFVGGLSFGKTRGGDIRTAMVKIYAVQASPYYPMPWDQYSPENVGGSGCIIDGDRIITNAHVVSDQTFVQVLRYGQAEKYKARVIAVSHAVDLALLTVDDPAFFKGVKPLKVGPLPEVQDTLEVMGFPMGGEMLSTTRGVVSRIEHQSYVHSGLNFLTIQVDAAINNGNSGGPAIINGKITGIAMQGYDDADNISYLIPPPVINHFISDLKDGQYDGYPKLGIDFQPVENKAMRRRFGLSKSQTGVLVTNVFAGFPADGVIYPQDILLAIDGHAIAGDGTIEFRLNERTSFNFFIQQKQIGDPLALDVLRKKERLRVNVKLSHSNYNSGLVKNKPYDIQPTYYLYGGLVLIPLNVGYLEAWGSEWQNDAPHELMAYWGKIPQTKGEEVIVLGSVLPHEVNNGYHDMEDLIITHVNGSPVLNMKDMVQKTEKAATSNFVELKTSDDKHIILNPAKVAEAQASILETYNIQSDRSPDLTQ